MEIYVVSWSFTDLNEAQNSSGGSFCDIFKTKESARNSIFNDIETIAKDELGAYEEADAVETFGTYDPKEYAKKLIRQDTGMYLEVEGGFGITRYYITKYDTDFAK